MAGSVKCAPGCACRKHVSQESRRGVPRPLDVRLKIATSSRGKAGLRGPANPAWRGADCGYSAAHLRTQAERGRAVEHDCIDCGQQAAQWSFRGIPGDYSTDPHDYDARCVPCHRVHDHKARQAA